jgi:hypothetical protein
METFFGSLPFWLLVLLAILLGGLMISATIGLLSLLIKFVVVLREARRPPHHDMGDYRLNQGREVRGEQHRTGPAGDERS